MALALPLLLAPGYALGTALFPVGRLARAEWWTVVGGLGLASIILTGLILDATPSGLDRTSWSIALACIALCGAGVGLVRGRNAAAARPMTTRLRAGGIAVGAIFLLGTFAALGIARQSASSHERLSRFTELWALPDVTRHVPGVIRFGVKNEEGVDESYRVVAVSGAGNTLFRLPTFRLHPGESRQWTRAVASTRINRVVLRLFKGSQAGPPAYRRVMIWIKQ